MEYELSFFNFDYDKIKKKIKEYNGKKIHSMVLYKVAYFYLCGENDFSKGFIRVRNENGTIVLTTKILDSKYPKEYETVVDNNYDNIILILENSGLQKKIETIKFREKWSMPGTHEVVFDLWPGLPLVMEVDCTSEKLLYNACKKLDLNIKEGFTEHKYIKLYDIEKKITQNFGDMNFKNFKSYLEKYIKKNKNIFDALSKKYYKNLVPKKYHNLI